MRRRAERKNRNSGLRMFGVLSYEIENSRFCSVTQKPFKVPFLNSKQILTHIRRRTERKNHNSCIYTF